MNESENFENDLWFPLYLEGEYKWVKEQTQEAMLVSVNKEDEIQLREQTPSYWTLDPLHISDEVSILYTFLKETRYGLLSVKWLLSGIHKLAPKQYTKITPRVCVSSLCDTFLLRTTPSMLTTGCNGLLVTDDWTRDELDLN